MFLPRKGHSSQPKRKRNEMKRSEEKIICIFKLKEKKKKKKIKRKGKG